MKGRKVISQVLFRFLLFFICITFSNLQNVYASEQKNILETKVEKFFQKLKTLESDFIQVSPSGKIRMGKIFLDLPGKLRIDYQNPNDLLITCKGMWVVIQNRKLKTTNNILLNQTPFSILLDKRVNFQNKDLNLSSCVPSLHAMSKTVFRPFEYCAHISAKSSKYECSVLLVPLTYK